MKGVTVSALASLVAALAPAAAYAHHSFASEFDSNLEGTVKGVVTRVWWQNPHIRYDVTMKMPDGSTQEWALLPPGNLPTYRTENWTEQTVQVGYRGQRDRQLGARGREKAVRHLHQPRERTGERSQARPLRERRARRRRSPPIRTSTTPCTRRTFP